MNILLTGGAGYIGSHTAVELIQAGHGVVIADNFVNSSPESINRIEKITGTRPVVYDIDVCDKAKLSTIFLENKIDGAIHFAGFKAVGESSVLPLKYYRNNLDSAITLLEIMEAHNVRKFIFSSSATVYGQAPIPYAEDNQTGVGITSPYGRTKFMIEEIIKDVVSVSEDAQFTILRYFNPIGAHESGLIGEDPEGIPLNIMPYISQTAVGKREHLTIFGNDYDTADGTCERDYIHVVDVARGHLEALENSKSGLNIYNLGSGKLTSVLQLVHAFESASGKKIAYEFSPRREGDLPAFYADPQKALNELNWKTTYSIEDMCRDTWKWQSLNPSGYRES